MTLAFSWPEAGTLALIALFVTVVNFLLAERKNRLENARADELRQENMQREERLTKRSEDAASKVATVVAETNSETMVVLNKVEKATNSALGTQYKLVADLKQDKADKNPTEANIESAKDALRIYENHVREQKPDEPMPVTIVPTPDEPIEVDVVEKKSKPTRGNHERNAQGNAGGG